MVTKLRPWTATEIHRLKGLAKKKLGVSKIARSLKRTTAATVVKAQALVYRSTREVKGRLSTSVP